MSGSFNIAERSVASVLSKFPGIKRILKRLYQRINYVIFKKKYSWKAKGNPRSYRLEGRESFFGYYDHSPLNSSGTHLLFHSVLPASGKISSPENAEIIVYGSENDSIAARISTKACNWQQGSRAMWLNDDVFIFNDYDEKKDIYISKKYSVSKGKITAVFDFPVYDARGDMALSLNFDRLQLLRPDYGYNNRINKISIEKLDDETDGLFKCDLGNGSIELLVSMDQLKLTDPSPDFNDAIHKINHLMISPDGRNVMYLHRWLIKGVKHHRLMLTSLENGSSRVLAKGMVSHCTWYGHNRIIGYMAVEGEKASYKEINTVNGVIIELAPGILESYGDGHPSVHGSKMLYDTYPGRNRLKYLRVYDLNSHEDAWAGEFFESMKYRNESRCDLHPRWSCNGRQIFFDSVHEGYRSLYSIDYDGE